MSECSVLGCARRPHARGWCRLHYQRENRLGLASHRPASRPSEATEREVARLYAEGISRGAVAELTGVSVWTVQRVVRRDNLPRHNPPGRSTAQRFWKYVDRRGPDECWPWMGGNVRGYGRFYVGGRQRAAHQVAWEMENGRPFPAGMESLHSCDNPPCVNPRHISPGTHGDNMRDAFRKGRMVAPQREIPAACREGHLYTEESTRITVDGCRVCRICDRAARRRRNTARRAA